MIVDREIVRNFVFYYFASKSMLSTCISTHSDDVEKKHFWNNFVCARLSRIQTNNKIIKTNIKRSFAYIESIRRDSTPEGYLKLLPITRKRKKKWRITPDFKYVKYREKNLKYHDRERWYYWSIVNCYYHLCTFSSSTCWRRAMYLMIQKQKHLHTFRWNIQRMNT